MQPEILPPENVVAAKTPQLKLRHLPLALLYLGGSIGALGFLVCGAVVLEAVMAFLVVVLIAGLILLLFPLLFLAANRKHS